MIFNCPECNKKSTPTEWNEETQKAYGSINICEINDLSMDLFYYKCPKCGKKSKGDKIESEEKEV